MGISIQGVTKEFGSFRAVDDVNLEVKTGSLVALLGPSGSGKSTLLRMVAGLEMPDAGHIYLVGQDATYRPVQERHIGFVFQHYALFKHLTVRQNVAFAMEIRKMAKARIKNRVDELLDLVQLRALGDRYPSQLSGGQRQRVALARALAIQPQVLLLDEPFGALDAKVRKELRAWLRRLHDEVHVTTVFVTHDQEEAMEVSDEIVVMNQGRVEQVGIPSEVYDNPASSFVMSFIGPVNVLPPTAGILPRGKVLEGDYATSLQNRHSADLIAPSELGGANRIFLRPHDVVIQRHASDDVVPARVERVVHLGWEIQVELVLETAQMLTAYISREEFDKIELEPQQSVYIKPKQVKVFSAADYALSGR